MVVFAVKLYRAKSFCIPLDNIMYNKTLILFLSLFLCSRCLCCLLTLTIIIIIPFLCVLQQFKEKPFFDDIYAKNVTAVVDDTAILKCTVKHKGDKTVS